jgi:hypothetical protein
LKSLNFVQLQNIQGGGYSEEYMICYLIMITDKQQLPISQYGVKAITHNAILPTQLKKLSPEVWTADSKGLDSIKMSCCPSMAICLY